jgi:multidrug efflux pump subunit AcrA (membrane-fusion protein)
MSETTPFADIPPVIVAMLRDEATLSVAINVLDDSRRDNLTRTEEINARKPSFGGLLSSKKDRDDYHAALKTVQLQLASIDALLSRAHVARERIQPILRIALVQHLGQSDPAHRQGLRASRFHEHWHRCHAIVGDRTKGFLRDLREAQAAFAEDTRTARARASSNTTWKLTTVRTAAAELERALADLNATAADHAAAVAGTPFAASTLPVVEPWNCIGRIDAIGVRPMPEAAAEAAKMLAEFTDIKKPALDTLEGMYKAAAVEHAHLAETSLRARWSELLIYAEQHLVGDAELEPALADIERRRLESETARLNAQIDAQAFRHGP